MGDKSGVKRLSARVGSAVSATLGKLTPRRGSAEDKFQWLEGVEDAKALAWVKERNEALPLSGDGPLFDRLKAAFDSKDKIPFVSKINDLYYNFWTDENHERGIWRRTTFDSYCSGSPEWTTVLDLDELSEKDGIKYVWHGYSKPYAGPGKEIDRVILSLSPGGGDSDISREFDIVEMCFIHEEEHPFNLPESKGFTVYKDLDTLLVGTDFGQGSMTDSGYPRIIKEWKRGTPLSDAKVIYECEQADVRAHVSYLHERGGVEYELCFRGLDFFHEEIVLNEIKGLKRPDGSEVSLPGPLTLTFPQDASLEVFADQFLLKLSSPYLGFDTGSLIAVPVYKVIEATAESPLEASDFFQLHKPEPRVALDRDGITKVKSHVILQLIDNVKSRLEFWHYAEGKWELVEGSNSAQAAICTMHTWAIDGKDSEEFWCTEESYIQPVTLSIRNAASPDEATVIKEETARFDAEGIEMSQHEAVSLDGTKIPYFKVARRTDSSEPRPTLLYGYGGFKIPLLSGYQVTMGLGWLEQGFVYVCANIRGGGEFGPEWHKAALKANRNKAYEDFEAVADDLVKTGVTTPKQLACQGGSNGGLLTGNMLARSPQRFGAIVIQVPLLDMKRYNKLLAGASWMGEYGNPDTDDWEYLQQYSPYHNLKEELVTEYPPTFFTSSTRDDRVHPGHARKMVAKLLDMGVQNVNYWENIEGGHGGAATNAQRAKMWTLVYQFMTKQLTSN